ncbi:MAG: hypothetical protein JO134_06995 [Xanthobacteraceae bacterium]|nr:hypothetical protein [Xanthobacteraceae bacterium]
MGEPNAGIIRKATAAKHLIILFAVVGGMGAEAWSADDTLPLEVGNLVSRREQCHHWAGEEPYDKARAKQIDRAMVQLKCDRIEQEVDAMRAKYANDARVQAVLPKDGAFE